MSQVLIVDGNKMFRTVLRSSLMRHLHTIDIKEAESAETALKKISKSPPYLIFIDIFLAGENGLKLTQKIKDRHPHTIVIVCTDFDSNEYRLAANRAGADYFVSKTAIKINELINVLQSHKDQSNM